MHIIHIYAHACAQIIRIKIAIIVSLGRRNIYVPELSSMGI